MTPPFLFRKNVKLVGARRSALDMAHKRLVLVRLGFALAYIIMAIRVVDLALIQGELQTRRPEEPRAVQVAAKEGAIRSDIVDRNGVLLASSLKTASLYADSMLIRDPEKVAKGLVARIPGLAYGEVLEKLQRRSRFVWIKRNLTPAEQFEILKLGEPGLAFRDEMRRIYPQGSLAAHIVGYTDVDGRGLAGIERSFDRLLADGGAPLRLSLDVRLQHILRREVQTAVQAFSARGGAGVILDMATGEVLAGVSLPDFDPHDISETPDAVFNRLTLGVYELGSTFKIFSTAAFLELKDPPMNASFDARKPIKRDRYTISDDHAQNRFLNLPEVFAHSSNIGVALMAEAVGTEAMRNFYDDLGLLRPLPLEIGETGRPLYPSPWREINTVTASYGHGVAVSPLQMTVAAASIAGDGTLVQPTLIFGNPAIKAPQNNQEIRIVSPQTAHRMRQLLRLAVTDGTGTQAEVPGYGVGGKTGTAEQPGMRGYNKKRLVSSFVGMFPMDAPRYAVMVMVEEPKGTKATYGYATGGWVAAPAVGRIVMGMAAVLGIEPDRQGDDMAAGLQRYMKDEKAAAADTEDRHLASY